MADSIRVCVFDAYGTLFDVHSAVARHASLLGPDAAAISRLWRSKQIEYSWIHSLMRKHVDFWVLTRRALDYALAFHGIRDDEIARNLLDSYLELEAYAEVPAMLKSLREAGIRTAILSNGSRFMLDRAVDAAGIGKLLDATLSIDDAGIYKPDPAAYRLVERSFDVTAKQMAFFSSNAWDAAGAGSFGFRVFWVNRLGQPEEYGLRASATELQSLAEVVGLMTPN